MAAGVAGTYAASQIDKKFNPEFDENGKKTGRGAWGGKIQDAGLRVRDSIFGVPSSESQQTANESDHSQPNKPDDKKSDNGTHNKSFNSDIDSMPNNSETVNSKKADTHKGSGSKVGWLSALAMPLVNEAADFLGIDKSQSLALSSIEAGSEILDGGLNAILDTAKAGVIGGAKAIRGDSDAGQYFSKNISSAASNLMGGFEQANDTMATYAVMQEFNRQQAAPQHQNFTTQPSGYNTYQAMQEQHQAVTASNVGTLATIVESRSGGFTLQDANTSPVSFTTSKAEGHNVMMNRRPKICTTKKKPPLTINCGSNLSLNARLRALNFSHLK